MASPWKFLTRLVSPWRQRTHHDDAFKDETHDALAGTSPAPPPGGQLTSVGQSTGEKAQSLARSTPDFAELESSATTGADRQATGEGDSAPSAETFDLALQHTGTTLALAASRMEEPAGAQSAKRSARSKKIKAGAVVSQISPVVPTISDEVSLDHEIRVLRDQLASKLRLQNAQLKQMLKRFDR